MNDQATSSVRTLAGRYEIGALLGRGGMAEVHEGFDTRLSRKVAIKLLRPSLATDPNFRTRFRQEAQAAARMAHPTIVRVFDAGEETVTGPDGLDVQLPFIVMERIDGRLLSEMVSEGPLSAEEATRVTAGILTALEYSHRAGVVHRDIKPSNIMVLRNGQIKVMDFGIARAVSESSANVAQTSAVLGTANYFSPEQARGEAVDARTDLYSTGVVLYQLLTGRTPFDGDSPVAVAYQHVSEMPTPPNTVNASVSPALSAVVMRALAKDRFERFQSAAEFKEDLEIAAGGKIPDRAPASDDFNATLFGVNPASTAASEATLRRLASDDNRPVRTQSRPPVAWIWAGITVMVAIIVAAMVWVFSLTPTTLVGSGSSIEVPDVAGMTAEAGMAELTELGLRPVRIDRPDATVDAGMIVSTSIEPGTRVSPKEAINVIVSLGAPQVTLNSLTFSAEADAIATIESLGLVYGESRAEYSAGVAAGQVMGIRVNDNESVIATQTQVAPGSTINLVVSNGLINVPDLKGKPITEAQTALQGLQVTVKLSPNRDCTGNNVTGQSAVGEMGQRPTITLSYCSG